MMKNMLLNEDLMNAERAFKRAKSEEIIVLCKEYLRLLTDYRDQLYSLRGMPSVDSTETTMSSKLLRQARKTVRAVLEITVEERKQAKSLLDSFTAISGHEAVKTFNQLKYQDFCNWELKADGVYSKRNNEKEKVSIQDATQIASLLRREEFIASKSRLEDKFATVN